MRLSTIAKTSSIVATALVIVMLVVRATFIRLGLQAFESEKSGRALALLTPFDGWGDTKARAALGEILYHSAATRQDYQRCLTVLLPAAESNSGRAALLVGDIFEFGRVGSSDLAEAFKWYEVAADAGNTQGIERVGFALIQGQGTEKDAQRGSKLLRQASDAGSAYASYRLGEMYLVGDQQIVDYRQARNFLEIAVTGRVPHAFYDLGAIYNNGSGVEEDHKKALSYFKQGLELGDSDSSLILGNYYRVGDSVDPSMVIAYAAYNLGVALGCDECKQMRLEITPKMSPEEIQAAQELCRRWKVGLNFTIKLSPEMLALQAIFGVDRTQTERFYAATKVWFSRKLTIRDRPEYVAFIASDQIDAAANCHSCGAEISIVTFDNVFPDGVFGPPAIQRNAFQSGEWGSLNLSFRENNGKPQEEPQIVSVRGDKVILLLDQTSYGQGDSNYSKLLIGYDPFGLYPGPRWRNLGSILTGETDENDCSPSKTAYSCRDWKSVVKVSSEADLWPDLTVEAKATKGFSTHNASWNDRYHYDGSTYILAHSTKKN